MPSLIDPTHPVDGVPASKGQARANWTAAKAEIEQLGARLDNLAIKPEDFGAIGDGIADDTNAVQVALDAVSPSRPAVRLTGGKVYAVTNIYLKNTDGFRPHVFGEGANLKKLTSVDNDYLLACSKWLNNVAEAQSPWHLSDITFNGNGFCTVAVVVWQCWDATIATCRFRYGAGDGLRITANTRDGTAFPSSTLVNNRLLNCTFNGNGAHGLNVADSSRNKATDTLITGGFAYSNGGYGIRVKPGAGTFIQDFHTYSNDSGGIYVDAVNFGTMISACYCEEDIDIVIDSHIGSHCTVSNCSFKGRLETKFNGAAPSPTLISIGNRFFGDGHIFHGWFGSSRRIMSIGDTFETDQPYRWHNSASPGPIFAIGSYSTGLGARLDGLCHAAGFGESFPRRNFEALLSLADDAAGSADLGGTDMGAVLLQVRDDPAVSALITVDCHSSSPGIAKLSGSASVNVMTGVLTGATGVDGALTVSAHIDGYIYVENRMGSTKKISVRAV